jgi:signal transduction histidine kinase
MIRILIVDDNAQNIYLLESLLKGLGYEVLSANNGKEALETAEKNPPDLIISDILMPVMDGFELCRQWRENDQFINIPFIFYTATYTEPKDEQYALGLGADRFVVKPQKPEVLGTLVADVLEEFKHKKNVLHEKSPEEEKERLHQYSEILFHKLEKKVSQLETEVEIRKRAENEVRKLNENLEERVRARTIQLETVNRELESFAYSVSHDLRAPLRHITGFINLIKEQIHDKLDDECLKYMEFIESSVVQMRNLIDDILSFSRMGHQEIVKTSVNLDDLVREVISEISADTGTRPIEWQVMNLPIINCDRSMLRIALSNLISNAVKYTRTRQQAKIEISIHMDNDNEAVIKVQDNGVGFDMKDGDKLFNVFQRLHNLEDFEGTGIGLSNVKRIIERHGGKVWADGAPDKGASFYFSLPKK